MKKIFKLISKFNSWLAIKITDTVSSMWCAYAFAILALCSLPAAIAGGVATFVTWFAQTFLQLVLLSVIMVGQEVQSKKANRRAEQDHKTLMNQFNEVKKLRTDLQKVIRHFELDQN